MQIKKTRYVTGNSCSNLFVKCTKFVSNRNGNKNIIIIVIPKFNAKKARESKKVVKPYQEHRFVQNLYKNK